MYPPFLNVIIKNFVKENTYDPSQLSYLKNSLNIALDMDKTLFMWFRKAECYPMVFPEGHHQ